MRYFYLIISVLFWAQATAQEQPSLRDRADVHYNRYEYARAIPIFEQIAAREKGSNVQTLEKLAVSYAKIKDYQKAESWFAKLVSHEDRKVEHVLEYARALKNNGNYELAKQQFTAYSRLQGSVVDVKNELAGCDSAILWSKDPKAFQLKNEATINTDRAEFGAYPVAEKLFFVAEPSHATQANTYGWTGESFLKIFEAGLNEKGDVQKAGVLHSDLNNFDYHVGPISSPDQGNTWFVTVTFEGKVESLDKENRRRYQTRRLALYEFTKNQQGAFKSVPFAYNNVEEYSIGHATFTKDGQTMYFASDMPGGFGQVDIWYSQKSADGSWSTPVNAGPQINTAQDELFPVINEDGHLYYSSDGLPGVGGLDIFVAKGEKTKWNSVINMGLPINSPADDFSYLTSSEDDEQIAGYLSSDRIGGKGSDDIYSFVFQKPAKPILISICGVTYDLSKKTPISANVELRDGSGKIIKTIETDQSGKYCFDILPGIEYSLFGQKLKYHDGDAQFSTVGLVTSQVLSQDLYLDPIMAVGKTFVLENLYYDFDKHNIRPDAALILDDLIKTLNEYPTMKIELSSHTDSRGSDAYNLALSQRRATSAVAYLIKNGIAKDRVVAKGYGETKLVNNCSNGVACSEADHQANRRTEVTILELNEQN